MRKIDIIVIHCSATRADRCYTEYDLTTDHLRRGFSGAGYHYYFFIQNELEAVITNYPDEALKIRDDMQKKERK